MTTGRDRFRRQLRVFWLTVTFRTGPVLFAEPDTEKYFCRCTGCGRVFMYYWAVVTKQDREQGRRVGCPCGALKFRVVNLPIWQQAWFLLSRYVWRKMIRKEPHWDPRQRARRVIA